MVIWISNSTDKKTAATCVTAEDHSKANLMPIHKNRQSQANPLPDFHSHSQSLGADQLIVKWLLLSDPPTLINPFSEPNEAYLTSIVTPYLIRLSITTLYVCGEVWLQS